MVSIDADNPNIGRCLHKLLGQLEGIGAAFGDDFTINCESGNISIEARRDDFGGNMITLPQAALLPVKKFELSLENDDIVIDSCDPGLAPETAALMETMMDLYNLTGKIATHRDTSSLLFLSSQPELRDFLLKGRNGPTIMKLATISKENINDRHIIDIFFKSRTLAFKNIDADSPPDQVLMPVIDFLNHHSKGALFQTIAQGGKRYLTVRKSQPLAGNESECFAFYGYYDGFDTWMVYDFVDESALHTRSVMLDIDLPGLGTVKVNAYSAAGKRPHLPAHMQDLRVYVPATLKQSDRYAEINFLIIPGENAPLALKRVLTHLLSEMSPGNPRIPDLVIHAEEQIIDRNIAYYQGLKKLLKKQPLNKPEHGPFTKNLLRMCDFQLQKIERYRDNYFIKAA